jgi:hypothetical protein
MTFIPSTFATVLAKVETTPGTDATPTGVDGFWVMNPELTLSADVQRRDDARTNRGTVSSRVGEKSVQLTFAMELTGAGSVALPGWVTLLKGCGMQTSGTTVTPVTLSPSTLTIYVYYGNLLHKVTGCVGSFKLTGAAGMTPRLEFTFHGLYSAPTTGTPPAIAAMAVSTPPVVENAALTYAGSTALLTDSFMMDIGNEIQMVSDATTASGFRCARIVGRNVTAGINPEVDSTQDFWTKYSSETKSSFSVKIGTLSGNRVLISAGYSQITGIGYTDRDGLRTFDLALAFCRGPAGDDEFSLFFD